TGRALRWCRRKPVIASLGAATASLLLAVAIGSPIAAARIEKERQRVQRTVIRQYVAEGNRLVDQGDLLGALPWFAKALKEDKDQSHEETHRLRLGSAVQQCPRLLQVWVHDDTVIDVQFIPEVRWFLAAGEEGATRVWDVVTGAAFSPPLKHLGHLRHARLSPDGKYVAVASEKSCGEVWEVATGRLLYYLRQGHPGFCINFSSDGHSLI